jgi:hypothetical protein
VTITESYMIVEPNGQMHERTETSPSSSPGGLAKRLSTALTLDGFKGETTVQIVSEEGVGIVSRTHAVFAFCIL